MFELEVTEVFSGAHRLNGYEGECRYLHGHNFKVTVTVKTNDLDNIGIGLDFKIIRKELKELLDRLDHRELNSLEPFKDKNPTSENIAKWIYEELSPRLRDFGGELVRVSVSESEKYRATYIRE